MSKWSVKEMAQYMIVEGYMPWEKDAIAAELDELKRDGAEFDFEVRLLRYEMECKMTAKDRKRVEARAKKLARSVASRYYDEGWRERDCIERASKEGYTPLEAFEIGHLIHMYEWERDVKIPLERISWYASDIFSAHGVDWTEKDLEQLMIEQGLTTNQTNEVRKLLIRI